MTIRATARARSGASVYAIPLRVGGGTRIKAFEAMAMGAPVVSTKIGVEGLGLVADQHYLEADDAPGFGAALLHLLRDPQHRQRLARAARDHVAKHHSAQRPAREFEQICCQALAAGDLVP
jgi:glycosyltransferase involved in cell wall biosynthesis